LGLKLSQRPDAGTVARAIQSVVAARCGMLVPPAFDPTRSRIPGAACGSGSDSSLSDAAPELRLRLSAHTFILRLPELQKWCARRDMRAKSAPGWCSRSPGLLEFDGKSLINLAKLYHKQEALILKAFASANSE